MNIEKNTFPISGRAKKYPFKNAGIPSSLNGHINQKWLVAAFSAVHLRLLN